PSSIRRQRNNPQPLASVGGVANPKGINRTTARHGYMATGLG
ncbi:hypothetical protein A2U01_0112083, partial [Trifolium medium]|nr:hypothetical protein [Trifolium medium]